MGVWVVGHTCKLNETNGNEGEENCRLVQIMRLTTEPRDRRLCPPACRTRPLSWSRGGCTRCSSCCPLGGAPAKERHAQKKKKIRSHFLFSPIPQDHLATWWKVETFSFRQHMENQTPGGTARESFLIETL